jgi:hypothetical protein
VEECVSYPVAGERECTLSEEVVDIFGSHALWEWLEVSREDVFEEGCRRKW